MIEQIELENWKTHGFSRLNFVKGTNILIGQMGAGKSSVLDAVSFALFGTFPSIARRSVNTSGIIRNRPEQKEAASVKLHLVINGDRYVVRRSLSLNRPAKATLEKNGAYVQSQPERVTEEIKKILKIDYDLFSRAIYSEQNGLEYFLNLTPTVRKKQIDELLGLDKFAMAQENAASVMRKIKDLAEEDEKTARGFDVAKLKEQLGLLNAEVKGLRGTMAAVEESLRKCEAGVRSYDSELRALKESYKRKLKLEQEIASNKSRTDLLEKEIAKIGEVASVDIKDIESKVMHAEKGVERAKAELVKADAERDKANDSLSSKKAERDSARKEKLEMDKLRAECKAHDRKSAEAAITELEAKISSSQKEMARNAALKEENVRWLEELNKDAQRCPVCERDLDVQMRARLISEKSKVLKAAEQAIRELVVKLNGEQRMLSDANASLRKIIANEEKLNAYPDMDKILSGLESELKKAEDRYSKAKSERDSANDALSRINNELAELNRTRKDAARRQDMMNQRKELERDSEEKSRASRLITVDQVAIDLVQARLTEAVAGVSRYASELKSYQMQLADKAKQIMEKESEIRRVEAIFEGVKKKLFVAENLSRFRSSLQETQTVLRAGLISSINSIMNDIWPDLYPYGDYTGITLEATADDYVLKVKTGRAKDGAWQDVEAIASGGEKSIGCLAMRIAFSLVLAPNLRWLILDEPTHNIDRDGLERFIKMFNDVLPRLVDQTFIITHDPILKQAYNSKVYTLTRNKGENAATVIEES